MLKIQKPIPKTLMQGNVKIKKKTIKKSKAKKVDEVLSKADAFKAGVVPSLPPEQVIKKHKKRLIEDIMKPLKKATVKITKKADNIFAEVQKPVNLPSEVVKPKKKKLAAFADVDDAKPKIKKSKAAIADVDDAKPKIKKSKAAINAEIPTSTKVAKKSLKRPLVLAPPESPVLPPKPTLIENALKKKQKKEKEEKMQSEKQQTVQKKQAQNVSAVKLPKQQLVVKAVNKVKAKKSKKSKGAATNNATTASPQTKLQKSKAAKLAYQKQMQKKKNAAETEGGDGKNVVVKKPPPRVFEPIAFDEEAFNKILTFENVQEIAKSLKQQVEADVTARKTSIFSDYRYLLNVTCFKIANVPKRMVKLGIKHSLVSVEDDVVIIVNDLQRGAKVDYEPTVQHYEDLFREAGIKQKLTIVPFNQLKKEYHTFEAVRKFGNTYDYFLCDGRIVGHVVGFCGKTLQKPRTTFHAIRLYNAKNIQNEFGKCLRRTAFKQLHKGNLISIPIGNHNFTAEQLAENVLHVVEELKTLYPGGLGNIRNMHLKIDMAGTISMPIYMSLAQAPPEVPFVVGIREKRMLKLKKEANEVLSKFVVNKDADIIKLTKTQAAHKQRAKEMRKALLADGEKVEPIDENDENDNDGDEDGVPRKRARVEPKVGHNISTDAVIGDDTENNEDIESDDEEDEDSEQDEEEGDNENGSEVDESENEEENEEEGAVEDEDDDDDEDEIDENDEDDDDSDDDGDESDDSDKSND